MSGLVELAVSGSAYAALRQFGAGGGAALMSFNADFCFAIFADVPVICSVAFPYRFVDAVGVVRFVKLAVGGSAYAALCLFGAGGGAALMSFNADFCFAVFADMPVVCSVAFPYRFVNAVGVVRLVELAVFGAAVGAFCLFGAGCLSAAMLCNGFVYLCAAYGANVPVLSRARFGVPYGVFDMRSRTEFYGAAFNFAGVIVILAVAEPLRFVGDVLVKRCLADVAGAVGILIDVILGAYRSITYGAYVIVTVGGGFAIVPFAVGGVASLLPMTASQFTQ